MEENNIKEKNLLNRIKEGLRLSVGKIGIWIKDVISALVADDSELNDNYISEDIKKEVSIIEGKQLNLDSDDVLVINVGEKGNYFSRKINTAEHNKEYIRNRNKQFQQDKSTFKSNLKMGVRNENDEREL